MEKNPTAKTWQIDTIDELKAFRDEVNAGSSFAGWTITLGADIDISGENWLPIGNVGNSFQGTFNGADHTITGLTINNERLAYAGFFGYVDSGSVQNVTFENVSINAGSYVGTVAGYTNADYAVCEFDTITVRGCVQITGGAAVGGIIGGGNAKLNGVAVDVATEEDEDYTADSFICGTSGDVGGIAGRVTDDTREGDQFSNLTSNIDVKGQGTAVHSVGGIFGSAGDNVTVNGAVCSAESITADAVGEEYKDFVGGIVGNYGAGVTLSQVSPQIDAISGSYVREADGVKVDNDRVNDNIFSGENTNVITVNNIDSLNLAVDGIDIELVNTNLTATSLFVGEGRTLTLVNAETAFENLNVDGSIKLTAIESTISGDDLTLGENALITIDAAGFETGFLKVIDLNDPDGSFKGDKRIVFENIDELNVCYGADGDICITDANYSEVFLTTDAAGKEFGELVVDGAYAGVNAFDADNIAGALDFFKEFGCETFRIKGRYACTEWTIGALDSKVSFVKQSEDQTEDAFLFFKNVYDTIAVTGELTISEGVELRFNTSPFEFGSEEGTAQVILDGVLSVNGAELVDVNIAMGEKAVFKSTAAVNVIGDNVVITGGAFEAAAIEIAGEGVLDIDGAAITADTIANNGRIDVIGDTDSINAGINGGILAIQNGAVFTSAADVKVKLIYVGYDYAAGADSDASGLVIAEGTSVEGTDAIYVRTGSSIIVNGTVSAGEYNLKGDVTVAEEADMIVAGTQGVRVREGATLTVYGDMIWGNIPGEISDGRLLIEKGSVVVIDGGTLYEADDAADAVLSSVVLEAEGTLTLSNGASVTLDAIVNSGSIALDFNSRITADTLNGEGTITIYADGFDGISKVIDLSGDTSLEGKITFDNLAEGINVYYGADGDVTLSNIAVDTFYVDSSFVGEFADPVAEGKYYGVNAFGSFTEALKKVGGATSKIVIADGSVEEFPDENISVALSQDLTISGGKFTWNDDSATLFYVSFVKAADAADDVTVNFSDLAFDSVSPTEGKKTYVTFEFGELDNADTAVKAVVDADTTLNLSSFVVREGSSLEVEAGGRIITHTEVARIEGTLSVKGEDGFTIDGATADAAQYTKYLRAFGTGSVEIANNYLGVYDYIQLNGGSTFTADNSLITIGADAAGVWHYNPVSNGFGKLDVKAGSKFTLENGSVLKASGNIVNAGVINVTGSTLLADGALVSGDVIKAAQNKGVFTNNGTVELSGESKAVIRELTGEGAFNVSGTAELDIANLASGTVTVKDGTTLKDSSVAGAGVVQFAENSITTFEGENKITAALDNSVVGFDFVVNENASLLISRYTLGYNRDITVKGTIEDATALETLDGVTLSLKADSTSGFSIGGWGTSVLDVDNAYVDLDSSSWKNATGTYTWNFTNSYIKAASLGNANVRASEDAVWNLTFTDSKLEANYIKSAVGVNFVFEDGSYADVNSIVVEGSLTIDATSEVKVATYQNNTKGGLDEHGDIQGTVNVAGVLDIDSTTNVGVELYGADVNVTGGTLELNKQDMTLDAEAVLEISENGQFNTTGAVTNGGTINVSGSSFSAGAVDNGAGVIGVSGESQLNIASFDGNAIVAADGATLTDSTIKGAETYAGVENSGYKYLLSVNGDEAGTLNLAGSNTITSIDAGAGDTVNVTGTLSFGSNVSDGFKLGNGATWNIENAEIKDVWALSLDGACMTDEKNAPVSTMTFTNSTLAADQISAKGVKVGQEIGYGTFNVEFKNSTVALTGKVQTQAQDTADVNISFSEKTSVTAKDLLNDSTRGTITFDGTDEVNFSRVFRNKGTVKILNGAEVNAVNTYDTTEHYSANEDTINVNGAALNLTGASTFANSGTIALENASFSAGAVDTAEGTFTVAGDENTVNITDLTGTLLAKDGATLTDSTVGGTVEAQKNLSFTGDNYIKTLEAVKGGTITVEDTLALNNFSFGSLATAGNKYIINGGTITANYGFFQHGTYTLNANFETGYMYYSYDSDITVNGSFHSRGEGDGLDYVFGKLTVAAKGESVHDRALWVGQPASWGEMAASLTVAGYVQAGTLNVYSGSTMTVDGSGTVSAGTFNLTGTLTINAGDDFDGARKVVDVTGTAAEYDTEKITVNGAQLAIADDGDIFIHNADMSTFYVDAAYTGEFGDKVAEDQYLGINAFNSFAAALDSKVDKTTVKFVVNSDTDSALSGKTISGTVVTGAEDGVTISDSADSNYVNFTGANIGENITVDAKYFYLYGENRFACDVKSSTTFYSSGKLTLTGNAEVYTTMSRKYSNADDGIYVVGTAEAGKGADAKVQFKANNYLGHYSGTFSVKDTAAEFGYILLNGDTDGDGYSSARLVLDNALIKTIGGPNTQPGQVLMNGDAAIIATNNSVLDFVGPEDFACLSMGEKNTISLTDSEMRLGREGQSANGSTINGSVTLASSKLSALGTINVGDTGSITTAASEKGGINVISASKIVNSGTITVGGLTTLTAKNFAGNTIIIADGATLRDTEVLSDKYLELNITENDAYVDYVLSVNGDKAGTVYFQGKNFISSIDAGVRDTVVVKGETTSLHIGNDGFKLGNGANWIIGTGASVSADYYLSLDSVKDNTAKSTMLVENASLNVKGISAKGTTQPIGSGAFDVTFNKANVTLGNVGIRIQEQSPESADINITFKESKFTADVNDLKNDAANSEVTFEATDVNFTRTFRNNGTLNITNGSEVSAKNLYATGEHLSANSGTINVKNATLNLSEKVAFDNSGTINVEGESTLNIGILTGNAVNVLEGATLTKSVLGGESEVVLVGNATVKDSEIYAIGGMEGADGNVTMNIIGTDASQIIGTGPTPENVLNGDLRINVSGTECDIMTAGSRTYNGAVEFNITDNSNVAQLAIGLSASFTDVAVKVDNSSVGVISAGYAIQIADEYKVDLNNAQIGSFEFLNGVIADEITIAGTTTIENALFGADLITVAENSIISAASIAIGAGAQMTVNSGAEVTAEAIVTNNGTLTVSALSTFTATDITRDGKIIIDAANFESGVKKIIDLTSTSSLEGSVEVINRGDNNVFYGADGDVYITDQNRDTIYVGSKYAGEFGTAADDNRVIGYNAFDAFAENTDPAASAFWKGVSAVVLSAGNSESEIYGSSRLMPSEGVTEFSISTTGEGYALLDRLSLRSASEPVEVTIEEGSRIKTTLGGYVNPNFTLTVNGEVDVAASGSGVDFRVYPDGILNVAKGGKFVVSGGQFISTGTVNVYGAMEINGKEGDYYAKLAGDDAQHASNFNIDGGSLAINQKAFSIGGGWGWTWLPITNGENCKFTITNNGTFTSTASYFRISAAGILDISNGGSMTFTNEDAASANGVYCNKNEGTVQLNGGALDVSNLKEFTNAGAMQLTGDAKLTVGDDFINETEITLEDFTGSVSGTINGGSVVFEGKSTLASAADFTETLTQVSDDAQLVIAENGTLDAELINNSGVIDAQGGKIDAGCIQMQYGTWELGGFTASTEDRDIEVSFIKEGDSILDGITFKVTLKAGETSISGEAFKGIFSDKTANNYMTAGNYIVTAADKEYEYAVRGDMTIEQGSFKVTGKSELHIAEINNGVIELHNGGEITDSSVEIGTVVVYGTTGKISGETSINILYVGYPDGYEIDSAAEVTITGSFNSTSNFVVGKFGTVNIGDAQGDRTTVNAKSASWINGSVVNLTNAGYSGTQALSMTGTVTLDNATVLNKWEGQMNVGNGSGKVTLKNNSSLEYTTYFYIGGYYETGEAVLEVTDSTVKGKWIRTSDKAVMTFNNSSLIATSSLSLKGELTLTDSLLDAASLVITESGKINADWDSAIEFDALTNAGTITFDMTGAEGCILKVMDYTGTGPMDLDAYGEVYAGELYNGFRVYNNDLYAVTADFSEKNVTLSTLWAGSEVYEQVAAGCIYGVNAVGSLNELATDVEKLTITDSEGPLGEFTFTHSDVALEIVDSDITADLTMTGADVTIAEGSTFAGTMTAAESIKLSGTGVINGTLSSDSGILTINDEITVNVIAGFTSITANAFEAGSISMTLGSDIFYANGNVTVETVDFMTGYNDMLVIADGVSINADAIESSGNLTISMGYADETTITVTDNGAFADNSNLVINLTSFTAGADGVLVSGITEFAGTVVYNGSQVKLGDKIFANGALYELAITEKGLGFAAVSGDYDIFSGDMDANKQSDILIFNANDNSLSAFLTAGDGDLSFSWGELGTLEEGAVILGTGKAYGTADSSQSIFYQIDGKIKACVVDNGVVTGTQDIYDIPENGAEIIGLGDFNNDGATDLLLAVPQSEDGGSAIGCIFSDSNSWNYFQSLGSEWDVTHVGDFNGDGRDDVVLEHGAGFAGAWLIKEDGTPEWAGLDSIANVETCGVGDFNGDGIDDVLVRNGEWVGAWIVGTDGDASNGLVDSFIGIKGDLAADASIEQIADFNKDGIDDIVVRTAAGDLGVLVVKGSESTEWNYTAKLTLA